MKLQRSLLRAVDDLYAKFRALGVFDNPESSEESREVALATLRDSAQANIIRGWCDYLFERKDPAEALAERKRAALAEPFYSTDNSPRYATETIDGMRVKVGEPLPKEKRI